MAISKIFSFVALCYLTKPSALMYTKFISVYTCVCCISNYIYQHKQLWIYICIILFLQLIHMVAIYICIWLQIAMQLTDLIRSYVCTYHTLLIIHIHNTGSDLIRNFCCVFIYSTIAIKINLCAQLYSQLQLLYFLYVAACGN